MSAIIRSQNDDIEIPTWVNDLTSFRHWIDTNELPEKLPVHFIDGEVWMDCEMEEFFSHNCIKTALGIALASFIADQDLGTYVSDGMRYTNEDVGFSTEPDAMYFSHETYERGDVEFQSGRKGKATELVGTPDLVIEIISPSTEEKDTDWLKRNYYQAGIPEYWLIDARPEEPLFGIWKRTEIGYRETQSIDGWQSSNVLGQSIRLTRKLNRLSIATYRMEMR
ncbi:MAG: Uma2 family endonuclease [Gemmataceae bacterium]